MSSTHLGKAATLGFCRQLAVRRRREMKGRTCIVIIRVVNAERRHVGRRGGHDGGQEQAQAGFQNVTRLLFVFTITPSLSPAASARCSLRSASQANLFVRYDSGPSPAMAPRGGRVLARCVVSTITTTRKFRLPAQGHRTRSQTQRRRRWAAGHGLRRSARSRTAVLTHIKQPVLVEKEKDAVANIDIQII